jgi:prepilin-type processing-associated H-X9-DG protein
MNGLVLLLPYIEQDDLYKQFDLNGSFCDYAYNNPPYSPPAQVMATPSAASKNGLLAATNVPLFVCPSDNPKERLFSSTTYGPDYPTGALQAGKTNYDFSAGAYNDYYYANYWHAQSTTTRYMFGENSTTRVSDVKDGTSNTIAMSELTYESGQGVPYPWAYRTLYTLGTCVSGNPFQNYAIYGPAYRLYWGVHDEAGGYWYAAASSVHSGGTNMLFGDGSVRMIGIETPGPILEQMATIHGGEVILNEQ